MAAEPSERKYVVMRMRTRAVNLLVLLGVPVVLAVLTGCTDRDVVDVDDPGGRDPGEQPTQPGAMFAPCMAASDCPSLLCVFPKAEAGYCSTPCAAPSDPGTCGPAPGDQVTSCLDIGLPGGEWACALDCEDGPCPNGMRCEQVAASDGERAICF